MIKPLEYIYIQIMNRPMDFSNDQIIMVIYSTIFLNVLLILTSQHSGPSFLTGYRTLQRPVRRTDACIGQPLSELQRIRIR